jgi:uncharacterized oligopeptide transporter (OPT) family protein
MTSVASGIIAGSGLAGVLNAVMQLSGVPTVNPDAGY